MLQFEMFLASSLEKVFADERPSTLVNREFTALKGDTITVQLVYKKFDSRACVPNLYYQVAVEGAPNGYAIRMVELMPSNVPCVGGADDNYMRKTPGMYPDLLSPSDGVIKLLTHQYRSVWIDLPIEDVKKGEYQVKIKATPIPDIYNPRPDEVMKTEQSYEETITIQVLEAQLPESQLIHTEWFHVDGIVDYYGVEVFSETFWEYTENFIAYASHNCAMNMLLTPIFTPPLDTKIGGERTTIQLIGVVQEGEQYTFDFKNLVKWCEICKKHGVKYLEISHFFTQWGAYKTPKIVATVNGKEEKIFGWHVSAQDPTYKNFLGQLMPQLLECLQKSGYGKEGLYFHVSDEPVEEHMESYQNAKALVKDLLNGYKIIDALSSVDFYKSGLVEIPVPANDHIEPFMSEDIDERWVYYCIAQNYLVPNRFFAMPSARNRIMGVLMYQYNVKGFLHWGYNFYNTQYSIESINPFMTTDCGMAFNSGDAYLVYPGKNGEVLGSIRNEVQMQAIRDLSACQLLESLTDRQTVLDIINNDLGYEMTFKQYPTSDYYLFHVREQINKKIAEVM